MLLWQGNSTYDTEADKRRLRNIWHDNKQDIGYNYQQERSFDTLENAVSHGNADAGSVMGAEWDLEWDSALEERWETSSLLWHRI